MQLNLVYLVKEHETKGFTVLTGVISNEKFKSNNGIVINTKNLTDNQIYNDLLMARMEAEAQNYYKKCA